MIKKIFLVTSIFMFSVFCIPISTINAGVPCDTSDCPISNPNCCNDKPPNEPGLDCSNDGVTNDCGGDPVWECPAGYIKTCHVTVPQCSYPGLGAQAINSRCGTSSMPNTGRVWDATGVAGGTALTTYWGAFGKKYTCCRTGLGDFGLECRELTECYGCSCQLVCTGVAPTPPTKVSPNSPANGSTITYTNVTLDWNELLSNQWGTSCVGGSNIYRVLMWNPTTSAWEKLADVPAGTSQYSFTGVMGNTYYWNVSAINGQFQQAQTYWSFTISPVVISDPWWQVQDGDVTTNGGISSNVPDTKLFSLNGLGNFHGVPVYGGSFNLSPTPTKISLTPTWHANTGTSESRIFDYAYFKNLIPDNVSPTIINNSGSLSSTGANFAGYELFKANSNLVISSDISFGPRKVILFVENGDLTINGRINVNDNVGFFGVFVNGNIVINPSVAGNPTIEGVYLSDGSFSTRNGTSQLHVRGSVVALGGVNLERDLTDNSEPAELFEYAPDQILLFPEKLGYRRQKWAEIAP